MKPTLVPHLALIIFLIACVEQHEETGLVYAGPKVVEAIGHEVPRDSISEPRVILIDENKLKKLPAGKPRVVPTNVNVFPAGAPKTIPIGTLRVYTPGQDTFELPEMVPIIDTTFISGQPEVVMAKDGDTKDQNPQNFSSYGKLQGLKHNAIYCGLEDNSGNIWLGTGGGATRYDGKYFSHFTKKEGLLNSIISCMLEDKSGNLWFGCIGGMTRYDGKYFTHFSSTDLSNQIVYCALEDKSGNLWFGTTMGIYKLSNNDIDSIAQNQNLRSYNRQSHTHKKETSFKSFTHYTIRQGLSHNEVRSIAEDKSGNLWFGTAGGGVNKFDGVSFTHFTTKDGLSNRFVNKIMEDQSGNLWFGTDYGANKYDGKYFYHYTTNEGLSNNMVLSIHEDKSGDLWFGTLEDACKFQPAKTGQLGTFTHFTEKEGLSRNPVWNFLEDKSGNFWICSDGSLNKYSGNNFTHFTTQEGLSNNSVRSVIQDSTGSLWFGTLYGGVSKYDGSFFYHYTSNEGLSDHVVFCITEDKLGNLWFGTHSGGITKFDGKTFTHFTKKNGLLSNYVACIMEDIEGNLWIGNENGICKYDGKYFTQFTKKEGLSDNMVLTIQQDLLGNFWFGTSNGGITKYQPPKDNHEAIFTHFTHKEGFPFNEVESIHEDKSGDLWFGTTASGLWKYENPKGGDKASFTILNEEQGLSDLNVRSIIEDHSGNLWLGTQFGLNKLSKLRAHSNTNDVPIKQSTNNDYYFKSYSYEDGFLGIGCYRNSMFEDKEGTIWIGANDRLTAYHPEGDVPDTIPPNMQLTGISIFNELISWPLLQNYQDTTLILGNGVKVRNMDFDSTSNWYSVPDHLSLRHDNNDLTFNFIGITQKSPKKVKYRYFLEGNDENWSAITSLTEAHYGNLSHGHFTFKVKAMNSEGYWSNEFQYPFAIRPPWWLTWWAYSLYALCIITLLWQLHKFQQARTIRIEREKTQAKELEQAKEIEKAYTELKATQAQLIQSEKMASLGQLTAGIAHEIQNPLNFVNNFSDVNKELLTEMKEVMLKGNFSEAEEIANDVIANEEKINHHGKRADAIVKGMLQHSRSSGGVKKPTDINALADEYLRLAYHGLRAKDKSFNATMKTEYDQSIGLVNVIPQDIGRVILNLITNAFYAVSTPKSPNGDLPYVPTVTIKTNLIKSPSGDLGAKRSIGDLETKQVEISVTDNGPGIPTSILDKIFQPFFTTKPTGQGTGLGLSLSYDIIKAHGGELKVETKEGEGTTFLIQLPII